MIALSLLRQAAERIISGRKSIEIRRWRPYVLPLRNLALVANERRLTRDCPIDPAGEIVAVVDVQRIRPWLPEEAAAACCDWEPGWLAWELSNIRRVSDGPTVPARRRLYTIERRLEELDFLEPVLAPEKPQA